MTVTKVTNNKKLEYHNTHLQKMIDRIRYAILNEKDEKKINRLYQDLGTLEYLKDLVERIGY